MLRRYELSDQEWETIAPFLPSEITGKPGCPSKDNRLILNAFEKRYNQRTSVERTFGDLKNNYNLDHIQVRKMERAKVFLDLSCIALIASRLSDAASKENPM